MNKLAIRVVTALAFVTCSCGIHSPNAKNPATTPVVARTSDQPYIVSEGDTLTSLAAKASVGREELLLANERLLSEHWRELRKHVNVSLEQALLILTPEERVAVASALAKPVAEWLAEDHKAIAHASKVSGFHFHNQPPALTAVDGKLGPTDVLDASTVLVLPPDKDVPKDVANLALHVAGNSVALVFYEVATDDTARVTARWMAQGLRLANKRVTAIVIIGPGYNRQYSEKTMAEQAQSELDPEYLPLHKSVALAAATRPSSIVLLTDRDGAEWTDDDALWAKGLPPVSIRYVGSDEPAELVQLAKASKGSLVRVEP